MDFLKDRESAFLRKCALIFRRAVLKEWERSAKEQSAAISILSKDRGRTMRTKRFFCFFIKHRKTVDRIK